MVEFYVNEEHFKDHLEPVYEKIAQERDVRWVPKGEKGDPNCRFAVVASSGDLHRASLEKKMIFYMEHGAGQTYNVRNRSYAGGPGRENVCLFLSPGPHVTAINKKWHPQIPSVDVGVPKLDYWHNIVRPEHPDKKALPVVCISFHWDCQVCPETRNGFNHFKQAVLDAKKKSGKFGEFELVGHCHPRARKQIKPFFEENGIEFIEKFSDVLDRADVYVCDNSSTIFEFASIGKPVVLLNPPHYRKFVHHGLRFWDYAHIGHNAKDSASMLEAIRLSLNETRQDMVDRRHLINQIYYACDGQAAERAASAIIDHIDDLVRTETSGNYIRCKRASMGIFGMLDKGQTVLIFPSYAIINDHLGKFRGKVSFAEPMDPDRRIRDLLKVAPRNYELVMPSFDIGLDDDDEYEDYSLNGNKSIKGFRAAERAYSTQELYIIDQLNKGVNKTQICYHSREKGPEFKRELLLRAWDTLAKQEIIVKDKNGEWEVAKVGSDKG